MVEDFTSKAATTLSLLVVNLQPYLLRLTKKYHFEKPNDRKAVDLMNAAARAVFTELSEIFLGYGISDEYR
jgi:tRNA(His) 5'-end guanylyltransferase